MEIMTEEQIKKKLESIGVDDWNLDASTLHKSFHEESFDEAIQFLLQITDIAKNLNHHPKILIDYKSVVVTTTTHDAGGITSKDLELINRIEESRR